MTKPFLLAGLAAFALIAAPAAAQKTPEAIAEAALKASPVFDGHNDVPEQLRSRTGDMINDFDFNDTTGTARPDATPPAIAMHTDLQRLRKGHVGAQFWSVWVTTGQSEPEAVRSVIEQIDVIKRLIARYPKELALVTTADEVIAERKRGRIAGLIGVEGGHSIGSSLGVLRQLYALGARYMTITHSKNTPWADSATDAPNVGGLNDFGRDVVREMNRIGMIVDLSHVSEATMKDVLSVAKAPVMFSHSGVRAVGGHPRNVPDSVLPLVKANGGVIMVVFLPDFVSETVRRWEGARAAETARGKYLFPGDPKAAQAVADDWVKANPRPTASIGDVADHIDHIRNSIGIDHIGVGGDYDGMDSAPVGMPDVSGYPALFAELARRGYSQADLEKIASGNILRVMRGVEAYAKAHAGDPPIETPVARRD